MRWLAKPKPKPNPNLNQVALWLQSADYGLRALSELTHASVLACSGRRSDRRSRSVPVVGVATVVVVVYRDPDLP